jgi:hypothetical protein
MRASLFASATEPVEVIHEFPGAERHGDAELPRQGTHAGDPGGLELGRERRLRSFLRVLRGGLYGYQVPRHDCGRARNALRRLV